MNSSKHKSLCAACALAIAIACAQLPLPARADGGEYVLPGVGYQQEERTQTSADAQQDTHTQTSADVQQDVRTQTSANTQQDAHTQTSINTQQNASQPNTALAREVLSIVNSDRAAHGLPAMRMDAKLCEAAYERALEIKRSFSHTRLDGSRFSTICEGAYAENIARGQRSAARVMAAWMSSPGHRKNILNPRYDAIGICALEQGGVMHWVQLFGRDG